MKMLRLVVVLTLGVLRLCAQKSPKEQAQVWIGITCSIYAAEQYSLAVTSGTPGEDTFINTMFYNYQGLSTAVSTGERLGRVYPGRLYTLAVGCGSGSSPAWTTADLHFNVPEGYVVYVGPYNMGRTPSTSIQMNSTTMGDTYYCNLEIRPKDGLDMLPAGYSRPPTLSAVTWGVSLGRVSGGGSAGALRWRFSYLSADALNANNLIFADPINSEVLVVKYSDNLAIRYIDALDCQVTVIRNSDVATGYTLNFYNYYDNPGSNLDFPGVTPYASYVISTPGLETYNNRVQIARTMSGSTDTWILAATSSGLTLTETNSSRVLTTTSFANSPVVGQRTEVATVSEISSAAVLKTTRIYQSFPLQEELVKVIADPDGLALTTLYEYGPVGTLTKLTSITQPSGAWEKYDYYSDYARLGQLARIYTPWLDAPSSPTAATLTNCKVTAFDYVGERSFYQDIPAGVTTAILGIAAGSHTLSATFDTLPSYNIWLYKAPMRTETSTAYSSASVTGLVTVRKLFHTGLYPGPSGPTSGMVANPDLAGRLYYEIRPDGTKVSASYNQGSFLDYLGGGPWASSGFQAANGSQYWCETYLNGTSTQTTADSVLVSTDGISNGHSVDPIWLIPYKSTRRQPHLRLQWLRLQPRWLDPI